MVAVWVSVRHHRTYANLCEPMRTYANPCKPMRTHANPREPMRIHANLCSDYRNSNPTGHNVVQNAFCVLNGWFPIFVFAPQGRTGASRERPEFSRVANVRHFRHSVLDFTVGSGVVRFACVYRRVSNFHGPWETSMCVRSMRERRGSGKGARERKGSGLLFRRAAGRWPGTQGATSMAVRYPSQMLSLPLTFWCNQCHAAC